jgi:hypothetical protein
MRRILRTSQPLRLAALWAVALALCVKMLIAPGMMPVVDAGGIRITLCTGTGPAETVLGLPGKQQHDQGKATHEPCVFGTLAVSSLAAADIVLDAVAIAAPAQPAALPPMPARAPPVSSLPPSTGPPAFA